MCRLVKHAGLKECVNVQTKRSVSMCRLVQHAGLKECVNVQTSETRWLKGVCQCAD